MDIAKVQIVQLNDSHKLENFGCGVSALNHFLKKKARLYRAIGYSVTHVAVEMGSAEVLGYIALSASCIQVDDFGQEIADRLEVVEFAMPTLHIGRLGVSKKLQGQGIGDKLLNFAIDLATDGNLPIGVSVCGSINACARSPARQIRKAL